MSTKSALVSAAVLGLGALALTACQPDGTGVSAGPTVSPTTASSPAPTASPASTAPTTGTPTSARTAPAAPTPSASPHGPSRTGSGGTSGDATSDAYAFTHPCAPQQLAVHVTRRQGAPSQRVIEVRNNGSRACGLSYYPLVTLGNAKAADGSRAVKPLIPSGLGGPPAFPVHAGRTVYAVLDLDPGHATRGTVPGIDELTVLPDGDHMPNAATLDFPLGDPALVLKPKLGLYRDDVADAVASMRSADYQS